ncbi:MAG: hypothetical protein HQK63_06355 [Desulfamplus sp.]|nr:hypothetical protein [Desulfamplus sp.]
MQDNNSNTAIKANEGNGISTATESLAFCVSSQPKKNRRLTRTQIQQFKSSKQAYQNKLWKALIGYDNETFEWRCC